MVFLPPQDITSSALRPEIDLKIISITFTGKRGLILLLQDAALTLGILT